MPPLVVLALFDRMRERMAVVENLAADATRTDRRTFLQVSPNDCRLNGNRAEDEFDRVWTSRGNCRRRICFDQRQDDGIGDESCLHDLGEPSCVIGWRQCGEGRYIADHCRRAMKGTDQV